MIISCLSQKGGPGKSTIARGIAVEYIKNGWDVHVADMDTTQLSTLNWSARREAIDISPAVDVATYRTPTSAARSIGRCNLLVVDGTPYATEDTAHIAKDSDLIVIPTRITHDDLEPALRLGQELTIKGVSKSQLLFVVTQVPESGDKEAMKTVASIKDWGFEVVPTWMTFRTAYGKAMDAGYSMTETRYASLNDRAGRIISAIADKARQLQDQN
ncbi:MAG: hypothetical protein LPD71_00015 [Shewanella sp.]|nr:hypothetical protein [Shewanella sp.]MCF1459500.1 hypothetical protein [Shewanella sp.]